MALAATQEYNWILTSNPSMPDVCKEVFKAFPKQKFIFMDGYLAGNAGIVIDRLWAEFIALFLLTAASISDGIDGAIARRTQTTTPFGAIADPYADKILVMAVFLAFASIAAT